MKISAKTMCAVVFALSLAMIISAVFCIKLASDLTIANAVEADGAAASRELRMEN